MQGARSLAAAWTPGIPDRARSRSFATRLGDHIGRLLRRVRPDCLHPASRPLDQAPPLVLIRAARVLYGLPELVCRGGKPKKRLPDERIRRHVPGEGELDHGDPELEGLQRNAAGALEENGWPLDEELERPALPEGPIVPAAERRSRTSLRGCGETTTGPCVAAATSVMSAFT